MKFLKTRINTNTKAGKAAQEVGSFTVDELKSALKGDQKALTKLYEMQREGEMAKVVMPAIIETIGTKVENEKEWNKFLGEYVQKGSQAELTIQKSMNTASLSNAKFVNGMKEIEEEFKSAWELEKGRHKWQIDYGRAKLFADLIFQDIDGKVKVLEQGSRFQQQQLAENKAFELKQAETLLKYGEDGLNTIHKRDYIEAVKQPLGILGRIRNALGI